LCKALDLEKSSNVDAAVSLSPSPESSMQVVAKSGVLTHVPEAFVASEIWVFLSTLAAAYPGCKGTSKSDDASSHECRSKKRGATGKASAVLMVAPFALVCLSVLCRCLV
jgi:hypothetical protein